MFDDLMNLQFLHHFSFPVIVRLLVLLLVVWPIVFVLARWTPRALAGRLSAQQTMILEKTVRYGGSILVLIMVLHESGFRLAPLLGAAGIVGVALGIASQTSMSNVISGFFLIAEQPFVVGDVVTIGPTTGQVLAIDMLSIKIRTFDNRYVRIPNETILKSEVTNITRFPIRRLDLSVSVAYKEDVSQVRSIMLDVAHENLLALEEPEPMAFISQFGESGVDFQFSIWTTTADYLKLKDSIQEELKQRFDQEGIEMPFPHVSLYTGSKTTAFPIEIKQS